MAYADIAEMADDVDLTRRMYGCLAVLGRPNGAMWVDRFRWQLVGVDEWVEAWAAAGDTVRRGWDPKVISDEMIRQRIVQLWEQTGEI